MNSVLFDIRLDYEEPFCDFQQRIIAGVLEAFQHQCYPLELVCEDLNIKYPEIPAAFNMLNIGDTVEINDPGKFQSYHIPEAHEVKFDMESYIEEYKNSIEINWTYKRELFMPATIEYMAKEYSRLVDFFTRIDHKTYKDYKNSDPKYTFKRN